MNTALIHDWLTNVSGGERVVLEIAKIFPKAPLYTSVYDPKHTVPFDKIDVMPSFLQKFSIFRSKREFLIPYCPFAFEQENLSKYDLVISSTSFASKGVITKPAAVHICYCHTPARYLWEPEVDPRANKGWLSGLRRNTAHNLRIWDRVAADRVDYFIANSKFVAKRIKKYYKRDSIVVYPPVDVAKYKPVEKKDVKDYYLFVSRLVGYKKCDLVIEAFNDLGLPLKIIGTGPDEKYLKSKAKGNVEFLGRLDDSEVKKYYAEAYAFIFAAEEDFGIVPVEAMASGRPVIAYKGGGVMETVKEGITGTFFDEQTPQCLINAVKRFKAENYNPTQIRQHALKFSSDRFRKEFKELVEEILAEHKKVKH